MNKARGRVVAVIQARLESARYPRKVLTRIGDKQVIEHVFSRVREARLVDDCVFAIPFTESGNQLRKQLNASSLPFIEGPAEDVLERYFIAATQMNADFVVRVTADCPLVDSSVIDIAISTLMDANADYVRTSPEWPDGLDVEVFTFQSLEVAHQQATSEDEREHVTKYFRDSGKFSWVEFDPAERLPDVRITLDYPEDLQVLAAVWGKLEPGQPFLQELRRVERQNPEIFAGNRMYTRNEGEYMNSGEKLYSRAKNVIPGGTMLLSKRPEMHATAGWPSYFDKSQGCYIWDLDGTKFTDVGWMGIGTNILGYSNPVVNESVRTIIDKGNLTTLNAPEEVQLAEKLCELHPWADMVRFTRSGGEAGAVAVRIARAASGRDHIAFCGYHGWHDWYLAANLSDGDALDGHLLPGLSPDGVPRGLKGTATPFDYNNLNSLRAVLEKTPTGVIYMEVERSSSPAPGFLQGVRDLANQYDAVLVFDECTSGFRSRVGGEHLKHGVAPDISVFGKTLGNGYAINAVVGRREVMTHAQNTFISSTFWTERIGVAAGLATLGEMERLDAPNAINKTGLWLRQELVRVAKAHGLELSVAGLPALTTFSVKDVEPGLLRTLITSELLKSQMLGANAIYISIAHTKKILGFYLEEIDRVFGQYREDMLNGTLREALRDKVIQQGFARLA